MRIKNKEQLKEFLNVVDKCKNDVYLMSVYGDRYNLKSELSKYVAIGDLLTSRGEYLEVFCNDKSDEGIFEKYFFEHPEVLK